MCSNTDADQHHCSHVATSKCLCQAELPDRQCLRDLPFLANSQEGVSVIQLGTAGLIGQVNHAGIHAILLEAPLRHHPAMMFKSLSTGNALSSQLPSQQPMIETQDHTQHRHACVRVC